MRTIYFGLYNICNGCNSGLESALHGMYQANMDLLVFQEIKSTEWIYMRESGGNWFAETAAPSLYFGGVYVFYRKAENFTLEALHLHSPNVFSFQMELGGQRWHVVG